MRKPMVLRTINYSKAKVKVYKPSTDAVDTVEVLTTTGTEKSIKKALPDDVKFIAILDTEKATTKRQMSLETFLEHSEEIK